ncbi:hypothetical protein [Roseateles sp.]|uniref:hypothetical protein n=1 Tax=Roseateles sp. TaxID=1971397 RepID=UPI003265FC6F
MAFLDIKLKREGRALHIVVAPRLPTIKKRTQLDKAIAEADPLRHALKDFLDLHSLSRRMLRHLGYLEHALATQGVKAFEEVPVEVLAAALGQLESIVTNWSSRDLADIRSRLAVAVKDRLQDEFDGDGKLSDFATASRMLIGDVPHSEFEELERQYQGLISQETIQAALEAIRTPAPDESHVTEATDAVAAATRTSENTFPILNSQ